jgi:hypothetical protein
MESLWLLISFVTRKYTDTDVKAVFNDDETVILVPVEPAVPAVDFDQFFIDFERETIDLFSAFVDNNDFVVGDSTVYVPENHNGPIAAHFMFGGVVYPTLGPDTDGIVDLLVSSSRVSLTGPRRARRSAREGISLQDLCSGPVALDDGQISFCLSRLHEPVGSASPISFNDDLRDHFFDSLAGNFWEEEAERSMLWNAPDDYNKNVVGSGLYGVSNDQNQCIMYAHEVLLPIFARHYQIMALPSIKTKSRLVVASTRTPHIQGDPVTNLLSPSVWNQLLGEGLDVDYQAHSDGTSYNIFAHRANNTEYGQYVTSVRETIRMCTALYACTVDGRLVPREEMYCCVTRYGGLRQCIVEFLSSRASNSCPMGLICDMLSILHCGKVFLQPRAFYYEWYHQFKRNSVYVTSDPNRFVPVERFRAFVTSTNLHTSASLSVSFVPRGIRWSSSGQLRSPALGNLGICSNVVPLIPQFFYGLFAMHTWFSGSIHSSHCELASINLPHASGIARMFGESLYGRLCGAFSRSSPLRIVDYVGDKPRYNDLFVDVLETSVTPAIFVHELLWLMRWRMSGGYEYRIRDVHASLATRNWLRTTDANNVRMILNSSSPTSGDKFISDAYALAYHGTLYENPSKYMFDEWNMDAGSIKYPADYGIPMVSVHFRLSNK